MKKNIIGIRREDLSKKMETRVAITPAFAGRITAKQSRIIIQPAVNPETNEKKRIFPDTKYQEIGAEINESLKDANLIFGIKEIDIDKILPNKVYFIFSHTHKGQKKNRKMLKTFVDKKCTLIDYELITNERNIRYITAFTYFAGYAGMIDSFWALGERLKVEGIVSRFQKVPQSIEKADLQVLKNILSDVGDEITQKGTTAKLPPMIFCFLGSGKTSQGAQEIFNDLPHVQITPDQVKDIYIRGSRNFIYKLVLSIPDMYRLKTDTPEEIRLKYKEMNKREKSDFYLANPDYFESNMDIFFPYVTVFLNCIVWSPKYPKLFTRDKTEEWYSKSHTLRVIGDISCDPEGGVEFSKDTWIDNPVFTYNPLTRTEIDGFSKEGISVMAVTNLPCEFPADASSAFNKNLSDFMEGIIAANYHTKTVKESNLPPAIEKAAILWKGGFTPTFEYMQAFLEGVE